MDTCKVGGGDDFSAAGGTLTLVINGGLVFERGIVRDGNR